MSVRYDNTDSNKSFIYLSYDIRHTCTFSSLVDGCAADIVTVFRVNGLDDHGRNEEDILEIQKASTQNRR